MVSVIEGFHCNGWLCSITLVLTMQHISSINNFFAATIHGWCLFHWKVCRHQRWLDKHIGAIQWQLLDTVSSTCSLSVLLVSRRKTRNESYMYYNTNSPSASWMTVVRNCCIHTHTCATYTNHGYYSRPAFILFSLWWIMGAGQRPKYDRWIHSTNSTMNELYSGISWHNRFWCALYACYEIMSS